MFVAVKKFLFTCGATFLLEGLGGGVKGIAGLGRTRVSPPSQFAAAAFSFHRKFAICLTSSTGVVFFGDGPYVMLPGIDSSKHLIYTPLILNPVRTVPAALEGQPSAEYFIGLKAIKINDKVVSLNKTLLSITKEGRGGTKISSVTPYTVVETSIYNALVKTFLKEMLPLPRVPSVAPFGVCFNGTGIPSTRVGPPVPTIDLVLQSSSVFWRIFGANSMVWVQSDVICLGFVDGGSEVTTLIVIGGHQLEDNLLQFDLAASRLGFSSSLLFRRTTCANFIFTSSA
ncbi:hypothetical protein SLA2020_499720 [Shorea laevis]